MVFQAELSKSKGTERLKDQKFDLAIKHYNRVISLLDHQETKVQIFPKKIKKIIKKFEIFRKITKNSKKSHQNSKL